MSNVVPIAARPPLFAEPAGRAGDWWEPLPVCAAEVGSAARREADRRRLPIDLLCSLVVERALIEDDIAACGLAADRARAVLADAADPEPTIGPGRLHSPYIRMLRSGESDYGRESEEQLARRDLVLPLRLHEAARALDLREVCETALLDEAVAWEIAAASSSQFMREWALRLLLVAFAA